MSFATSVGRGTKSLVGQMGRTHVLEPNCVLIGARDLDPLEREVLRQSKVTVFTMREIDELGMFKVMRKAMKIACDGTDALHVSFDLDSMDPMEAPGVGHAGAGRHHLSRGSPCHGDDLRVREAEVARSQSSSTRFWTGTTTPASWPSA